MINYGLAKSDLNNVTIRKHTEDLLRLAEEMFLIYPTHMSESEKKVLLLAIKLHDIGKYAPHFQNMLYSKLKKPFLKVNCGGEDVYHEHLSVFAITDDLIDKHKLTDIELRWLVHAVAGHHARVIDFQNKSYEEQLKKCLSLDLSPILNLIQEDFPEITGFNFSLRIKSLLNKSVLEDMFNFEPKDYYSFAKIVGNLNQLDYMASSGAECLRAISTLDTIKQKIEDKYPTMRPLQKYMYNNRHKNVVLIAPTGSGKTEAGLFWADGADTIYTLPLKVAINATTKRLMEDYGYPDVRTLHSDSIEYYFGNGIDASNMNRLITESRLFMSPITVTTVDQIFKFVFFYHGMEYILSMLSRSKVIIDELQMYSPDVVASILVGLKWVTKMGGNFSIITATLPQIFIDEMRILKIPFELSGEQFKRLDSKGSEIHQHKIALKSKINIDELIEASKTKKVLLVVNTVKKAQQLYSKLHKSANANILHARYIGSDRAIQESKILNFAHKDRIDDSCGIWVATQIVEVSLDVDFDELHSEICPIDSLLQRMGRCYRHRPYEHNGPNVFVYLDELSGVSHAAESRELVAFTTVALKKIVNKDAYLLLDDDKNKLIEMVYDTKLNPKILKSEYYKVLKKRINVFNKIMPYTYNKKDANKEFRNIQSLTVIPISIYEKIKNDKTIDAWISKLDKKDYLSVKSEIKKMTLSVPAYLDKHCCAVPDLKDDRLNKLFENFLLCERPYDFDGTNGVGLRIEDASVSAVIV